MPGFVPIGTAPLGVGALSTTATVIDYDQIDESSVAMRVSGLDSDNDWTFGRGRANYKVNSEAIKQNIQTRLKMFKYDYYLDIENGIDWDFLLSNKNTEDRILRDVQKTVLTTEGVISISDVSISTDDNRHATMYLTYSDFFGRTETIESEVA